MYTVGLPPPVALGSVSADGVRRFSFLSFSMVERTHTRSPRRGGVACVTGTFSHVGTRVSGARLPVLFAAAPRSSDAWVPPDVGSALCLPDDFVASYFLNCVVNGAAPGSSNSTFRSGKRRR